MRRMEPSQIRALLAGLVMLGPMPADSQLPQEVIRVFDVSRCRRMKTTKRRDFQRHASIRKIGMSA
nr:hypothetical protein RSP597_23010 [Ralstonia solanacearum]